MKCAVINSSQLAKTGRWDAGYNIATVQYAKQVEKLKQRFTYSTLLNLAIALPFNKEVQRDVGRKCRQSNTEWLNSIGYDNLTLYVAMYDPEQLEKAILELRIKAVQLEIVSNLLKAI